MKSTIRPHRAATGAVTMTALSAFLLTGLAALLASAEEGKVKLPLKLPEPILPGTPLDFLTKNPNVEPLREEPRPVPLVPKGTVNLAAKKKVTSSCRRPNSGKLDQITDGDKEAYSAVELPDKLQWVQIDLGAPGKLFYVVVWHYHMEPMVFHDVIVQVSDDPNFVTGVKTIYNNDIDNSAGLGIGKDREYVENYEGRLIDAKGVTARYVRLYSNESTWRDPVNFYTEVEVYGLPAK